MGKLFANTIQKSVIQSLLHRSYEICSSYQLIHNEFQNIKSCFLSSGYPDWFIDKQIKIFLNKLYKNTIEDHFKYKDKQAHLELCNVVYKLKCSCDHSHVGETQRNLKFRLRDHNR